MREISSEDLKWQLNKEKIELNIENAKAKSLTVLSKIETLREQVEERVLDKDLDSFDSSYFNDLLSEDKINEVAKSIEPSERSYNAAIEYLEKYFDPINYIEEARPYIAITNAVIERNNASRVYERTKAEKHFFKNLKYNFDILVVSPIAIGMELGKIALSYTLGLIPLYDWLSPKLNPIFQWDLPTLNVDLRTSVHEQDYNEFSLGTFRMTLNPLTILIAPFLYFWRNVGKLLGGLVGGTLSLILAPAALIFTAIDSYKHRVYVREKKILAEQHMENANQIIYENLPFVMREKQRKNQTEYSDDFVNFLEIGARKQHEIYFYLGNIYRDRLEPEFQKALCAYSKVPPSSVNFVEAMYEAANIAFYQFDDLKKGKELLDAGLKAALEENHELADNLQELLRVLVSSEVHFQSAPPLSSPNEGTLLLEKTTGSQPSWEKKPPASNYHNLVNKIGNKQDNETKEPKEGKVHQSMEIKI